MVAAVMAPCDAATAGLAAVTVVAGAVVAAVCVPSVFSASLLPDLVGVEAAARINAGVGIKRGAWPGNTWMVCPASDTSVRWLPPTLLVTLCAPTKVWLMVPVVSKCASTLPEPRMPREASAVRILKLSRLRVSSPVNTRNVPLTRAIIASPRVGLAGSTSYFSIRICEFGRSEMAARSTMVRWMCPSAPVEIRSPVLTIIGRMALRGMVSRRMVTLPATYCTLPAPCASEDVATRKPSTTTAARHSSRNARVSAVV